MPGKFDAYENAQLDHGLGGPDYSRLANVHFALFTTLPGEDGTGGVEPAVGGYARVSVVNSAVNFPAASAGQKANGTAVTFPTATADWGEVIGWGLMNAASGTGGLYFGKLAGAKKFATGAAVGDTLTSAAHGFSNGQAVRVETLVGLALPAGLSGTTTYYVINAAANTFQLSTSIGGAAVDLTADGVAIVRLWHGRAVNSGDTPSFAAGQLVIVED